MGREKAADHALSALRDEFYAPKGRATRWASRLLLDWLASRQRFDVAVKVVGGYPSLTAAEKAERFNTKDYATVEDFLDESNGQRVFSQLPGLTWGVGQLQGDFDEALAQAETDFLKKHCGLTEQEVEGLWDENDGDMSDWRVCWLVDFVKRPLATVIAERHL